LDFGECIETTRKFRKALSQSNQTNLIELESFVAVTGMTEKTCIFVMRRASPFIRYIRSIFIQTEQTPNIDALKFKPGKPILETETGTKEFLSRREAMASPLASKLFQIDGVNSVFFGYDFITITKEQDSNWQLMKPGRLLLIRHLCEYYGLCF
jgi:hypothetical protein